MKIKIVFLILLLFGQLSFAMEMRDNVAQKEIDDNSNEASDTGVNYFDQLPDEVVLDIFSFFYDNYKNESKLFTTLLSTFGSKGSKDLANLRSVNWRFRRLAEDQYSLLLDMENKEVFQKELFRICRTPNPTQHDLKILRCLLKASILKPEILDINAKDEDDGSIPLYWAARWGNCEVVKLILKYIAKAFALDKQFAIFNAKDKYGNTPLIAAVHSGNNKEIELMLNHIGKFDVDKKFEIINAKDKLGRTPLHLAARYARYGHYKEAELIISYISEAFASDLNKQFEIINAKNNDKTALDIARIYNCTGTVQLLEEFEKSLQEKLLAQKSK